MFCNDQCRQGRVGTVIDPGCIVQCPNKDLCRNLGRCRLGSNRQSGDGPESGSEGCCAISVPSRNWFLEQMGIVIRNNDSFFHLLLSDNRTVAHQLLLIFMENFCWGIRPDVLSD